MNFWQRRQVIIQPPSRPESPAEFYVTILKLEPFSERAWAFAAWLGEDNDKTQALQYALKLSADPEPYIRWAGAIALVRLHQAGLRDAEKGLWSMMQDPVATIRAKIARELNWDTLPESARLKQVLATDKSAEVRYQAAAGLYAFPDAASREALRTLTHDPEGRVRAEAIRSLQIIEKEPLSVRDFISFAQDPFPDVRAEIACWLWNEETEFALRHLLCLLADPDAGVRYQALQSIGHFSDQRATDAIVRSADDPDGSVRALSLRLLGETDYAGTTELLLAHSRDPISEVRKVVAQQLENRITPEMLPVLEPLSEDEENVNTRRSALRSLEKIPGERAEVLITRMLRDPSQMVCKAAKKALIARAKNESIALHTSHELRYGQEHGVGTKAAFLECASSPFKAWEVFLSEVQRLDGRLKALSSDSPCVQVVTQQGGHHCLLPFGPAHWIRLDFAPQLSGSPSMGYCLLLREEVQEWSRGIGVRHFAHGKKLSERFGWFERSSSKKKAESHPREQGSGSRSIPQGRPRA